jgi:hypothetical protein
LEDITEDFTPKAEQRSKEIRIMKEQVRNMEEESRSTPSV